MKFFKEIISAITGLVLVVMGVFFLGIFILMLQSLVITCVLWPVYHYGLLNIYPTLMNISFLNFGIVIFFVLCVLNFFTSCFRVKSSEN